LEKFRRRGGAATAAEGMGKGSSAGEGRRWEVLVPVRGGVMYGFDIGSSGEVVCSS